MRPLSRRAAVVTAASAAVMTALSPAVTPAAGAVPAPVTLTAAAPAAVPLAAASGWTAVSGPVDSTTTATFLRGSAPGSTTPLLRLFWPQRDPDGTWSVRGRQVLTGGGAGALATVVSGWHDLNTHIAGVSAVCESTGQRHLRILFAGNRTTNPADPQSQGVVYGADSPDGASWTADATGSYSNTRQAAATYGLGAATGAACDATLAAFTAGSSTHVSYHVGPEPGIPAASPDGATADTGTGVTGLTAVRRSTPAGPETWVVWASNPASGGEAAVHAQRVLPTPGPVVDAPGSAGPGGTATRYDPPFAAAGGGDGRLWVVYRDAAQATAVRLWQVGAPTARVIRGRYDVQHVALTTTDRGALWAAIADAAGTRANPSIRALRVRGACSVTTPVAVPTRRGSYTNVWQIGAAPRWGGSPSSPAFGDSLHLWLNASVGSDDRIWHASVLPSMQVKVTTTPSPLKAGKAGIVKVTVTDACVSMNGVTVAFRGQIRTTVGGVATFGVPKTVKRGVYPVAVRFPGYAAASTQVRVR